MWKRPWPARVAGAAVVGLALLAARAPALAEDTVLADPPPSVDAPRKVVLTLTTDDPRKINSVLYNAVNVQKFYGMDHVQIAVVAWGPGVRALLRAGSPVRPRIESLLQYDIEFVACGNTMTTMHWHDKDLIDGVAVTTAGIPEVIERRLRGWIDINP